MLGVKLVKSGQIWISIDHCLVPRARMEDIGRIAQQVFTGDLDYSCSDSCTGIISPRHFDRQLAMLEEARTSGARVVQLDLGGGVDEATRRLPAALAIDPDPVITLMNE
jgi:coniferyl-aldehyde dehydrogenase